MNVVIFTLVFKFIFSHLHQHMATLAGGVGRLLPGLSWELHAAPMRAGRGETRPSLNPSPPRHAQSLHRQHRIKLHPNINRVVSLDFPIVDYTETDPTDQYPIHFPDK